MCRIVSFRGEGFSVFCSNRHVVWCVVRSSAHKHFVGCVVSTYSICYVFIRVLISSATVCFDISCCMQGTPTEHFSSMFMCIVFLSRLTPTVEPMTAGTHSMLLPRAICYRDLEDRNSRQDISFIEIKSEERFYWCRRGTQYTAFTFAHLRMLRQSRLELWSM